MDEVGEYCRQVEAYLTRVNGGHLIRIAGPAFALVRGWAEAGIPLSVVCRGIDAKQARHAAGQSRRPLHIEFCEADVLATFDAWRRAVGVSRASREPAAEQGPAAESLSPRQPSLSKHLDRVIDRLGRLTGRLDLPDSFREELAASLRALTELKDQARRARGPSRATLRERLPAIDHALAAAARRAAGDDVVRSLEAEAEQELAAFSGRLDREAWRRAVEAIVDRRLRERVGLPVVEIGP